MAAIKRERVLLVLTDSLGRRQYYENKTQFRNRKHVGWARIPRRRVRAVRWTRRLEQ